MAGTEQQAWHVLGALVGGAVDRLRSECDAATRRLGALSVGELDVEEVHQIRIGTRRLRAVCSFGQPVWKADPVLGGANDVLRKLAQPFGPVRDLDVQIALAGQGAAPVGLGDQEQLARALGELRPPAAQLMSSVICSSRWCQAIDSIDAAATGGAWRDGSMARDQESIVIAHLLDRWWWTLSDGVGHLDHVPGRERHRVRIRAKKFRYVAELMAIGGTQGADAFAQAAKALQDALGVEQDQRVAHEWAERVGFDTTTYVPDLHAPDLVQARQALDHAPLFWR